MESAILKNEIMFSKACIYGIKATIYIAMQSSNGKRVPLRDIIKISTLL